jgi:hypothetical protein
MSVVSLHGGLSTSAGMTIGYPALALRETDRTGACRDGGNARPRYCPRIISQIRPSHASRKRNGTLQSRAETSQRRAAVVRVWTRVTYLERCGNCGAELREGDPVQTITRHGLNRKLLRGVCCADGEPPGDLPRRTPNLKLEDQIGRMKALSAAMPARTRGALKQMAAQTEWVPYKENREPGEDG